MFTRLAGVSTRFNYKKKKKIRKIIVIKKNTDTDLDGCTSRSAKCLRIGVLGVLVCIGLLVIAIRNRENASRKQRFLSTHSECFSVPPNK